MKYFKKNQKLGTKKGGKVSASEEEAFSIIMNIINLKLLIRENEKEAGKSWKMERLIDYLGKW